MNSSNQLKYCLSTAEKCAHDLFDVLYHYENTPIQIKNSDIFYIFAQNIDCGYSFSKHRLWVLDEAVLTSTHNICF